MKLRASAIVAGAWASWRADWATLTAIAGAFLFLPQLAVLLLVPDFPDLSGVTSNDPDDPGFRAAMAAVEQWLASYGPWQLGVILLALFAQFAIVSWYVTPRRPSVGQALAAALRSLPRLVAASLAWMLPLGLLTLILLRAQFLIFPVTALVLGRTLLVGPAILAERPIGAMAAIRRSFAATRGNMLMLASAVLGLVIAQYLLMMPFVVADHWMALHAPNPVARAIVDVFSAAVATLGGIALALVQVAAWRRLGAR